MTWEILHSCDDQVSLFSIYLAEAKTVKHWGSSPFVYFLGTSELLHTLLVTRLNDFVAKKKNHRIFTIHI